MRQAPAFVLLHGGAHGGWCYRWLAAELRRRGHPTYAPTLTGFGERAHLDGDSITMATHVADVANVITSEDLDDVVLVGHSMGGVTIPFVAEEVHARIRRVVWLAAIVLGDGESILTHYGALSEAVQAALDAGDEHGPDLDLLVEAFVHDGTPEQKTWVRERLGPTTMASLTATGELTRFLGLGLATGYLVATADRAVTPDRAATMAARLPGALVRSVDAGHDCMITKPVETADALEAML